ncbi:MAG: Transcriptional regulator, TraR/DksA family [Microgenomates group bacterium GW2011_GWA2_40_6]|nr:MAG: Transcriptional regulator, TraR/DksA family [Microgenomates group bacterium GW2011_GWA2_40_6]
MEWDWVFLVVNVIPEKLTRRVKKYLEKRIVELKKSEKKIKRGDPFSDSARATNNSLEEDVDEQIGHFESEIKVSFVKKQIIEFRKALTKIKIGKYGICDKCGEMIDTDRLAVRPEATVCMACEKEGE